jgi:hypothetical protein
MNWFSYFECDDGDLVFYGDPTWPSFNIWIVSLDQ